MVGRYTHNLSTMNKNGNVYTCIVYLPQSRGIGVLEERLQERIMTGLGGLHLRGHLLNDEWDMH